MSYVRRYQAAGGVVFDGPQMLLLRRAKRDEIRLPKGHVDPGESEREAALRETREESGYRDLEIVARLGRQQVAFRWKGRHVLRSERYYLMRLSGQSQQARPAEDEAQFEVVWLPAEEAAEALSYASERQVAREALATWRSMISE